VLFVAPGALVFQGLSAATEGPQPVVVVEFFVALLVIVALNGMFVAGDTAIDLLRPSHGKALESASERRQAAFQDLIERKSSFVAACSLGSMTMRAWMVALAVLPAISFSVWLRGQFPTFRDWAASGDVGFGGVVLVSVLVLAIPIVALNVIFGELIPKSYAAAHPLMASLRLYGLVKFFNALFSLPIAVFVSLASLVTKRFGARATFAVANQTEEEIKELLEEAEESGEIEEEEKEMVASVFEFGDTVAREVMTPRADLEALPIEATLTDVVHLVETSGHSRIPVYEGTDDTILGIVHAKDVLSALADGGGRPLRELLRPALFVPENKPLHDLLQEMRQAKAQLAIVQDEHSGTAGVVTIEDIVEEVMGEIVDEYDPDLPQITEVDGGFFSDGKMELEDVNDTIGASFESEEFDTIGGYVFGLFGRQPKVGESIEVGDYRFRVDETDGKRVTRLWIERLPQEEPDAEPVY
jgi:putative hemolysin